jgi:hypothetical protein
LLVIIAYHSGERASQTIAGSYLAYLAFTNYRSFVDFFAYFFSTLGLR